MKNAPLITHVIVAITATTTFLFQMATLIAYINDCFGDRMALLKGKTYIRSTIKNEAGAWDMYVGS
jgi:hypothetical protein